MNILIIYPYLFTKNSKHGMGKQISTFVSELTQQGDEIKMISLSEVSFSKEHIQENDFIFSDYYVVERKLPSTFQRILNYFLITPPPHSRNLLSKEVIKILKEKISFNNIDLVLIITVDACCYLKYIDASSNCLIICDTQEIQSRHYLSKFRNAKFSFKKIHILVVYLLELFYEKKIAKVIDGIITISKAEKEYFQTKINNRLPIHIMPPLVGARFGNTKIEDYNCNIVFIGSFNHTPNIDAIRWFIFKIFPLIAKMNDKAHVYIVGVKGEKGLGFVQNPKKRIIGGGENINYWYNRAGVFISPILTGGGARIKNIEALAHGCAMVTTKLGSEGMEEAADNCFLVAENEEHFAKQVCFLLENPIFALKMGERAKIYVNNKHDASLRIEEFKKYIQSIKDEIC